VRSEPPLLGSAPPHVLSSPLSFLLSLRCDIHSNGRSTNRSIENESQLAVAGPFHVVLDLRGQGGEIALTAVIDNNDEPV
jgi:hypothetical protein